jgi:hypothetical protein
MRLLVCGSRTFTDDRFLFRVLDGFLKEARDTQEDIVIIAGGARGADHFAERWANFDRVPCEEYPADWATHGKAAGPIRNQQMLDDGKPDLVLAFVDKPLAGRIGRAVTAIRRRPGERARLTLGTILGLALIGTAMLTACDDVSQWWLAPWGALVVVTAGVLMWDDWHRR